MSTPATAESLTSAKSRPYFTLGSVAAAHSATHMYNALMPIIYPHVMAEFGFSYAQLGLMLAIGNSLSSILQGIYGFLSRRVPRPVLLGLGNVILAISMILTGMVTGFPSFFGLNIIGRMSQSPQHPVGNSLISATFGKKLRGTAFAINFAGGNAGTLLIPLLGTLALVAFGWRQSLMIFALVPLVTGLVCMMFVPDRRQARSQATQEVKGRNRLAAAGRDFFAPLRDRNVALLVLASSVAAGGRGIGVVMNYVPLYLQQHLRVEPAGYVTLYTLLMIGSVVGPLLLGRLADNYGRKRMAVTNFLLALLSTVGMLAAGDNLFALTADIILMGLVVYSQGSLVQSLVADFTNSETRDMAYSVFFTIAFLAGAIWSYALGETIDRFGFNAMFVIMSISYLAGALALLPVGRRASQLSVE